MAVKCLLLKGDYRNPLPTYQELDALSSKSGKVIYGGGKRKSQSVPFLNELTSFGYFCSSLMRHLNEDTSMHSCEVYILQEKAVLSFILLKFQQNYVGSFMLDQLMIEKMHHLDWSIGHIEREIRSLENVKSTFEFYKEKKISDKMLERHFPSYLNSTSKFLDQLQVRKSKLIEEARVIFNSSWSV